MRKHFGTRYLLITFLISYISWGIILLAQSAGWFEYGSALSIILLVIGGNSPAIASYLVKKQSIPGYTAKQFFKEAFTFKQKPIHYVLLLASIAIFFAVPWLMGGIAKEAPPIFGGTEASAPTPLWLCIVAIPLMFFGGGSEELGWRHFLQPHLEKRMPFLLATISTGLIWTVWHLPLFFIVGTAQYATDFGLFFISVMASAFVLAALQRIGKGAFLCILFHCATNSLQGAWPIENNLLITVCTAAVLVAFSLAVLWFARPNSDFRLHSPSASSYNSEQ